MRFSYQSGEPQIIIRFFSSKYNTWIPLVAYVDSGATYSIFHGDVADLLGIDLEKGKKVEVTVGNGAKIPVFLHKIMVRFLNEQFGAIIGFSSLLGVEVNLLGQKDFFGRFKICFESKNKYLEITKIE